MRISIALASVVAIAGVIPCSSFSTTGHAAFSLRRSAPLSVAKEASPTYRPFCAPMMAKQARSSVLKLRMMSGAAVAGGVCDVFGAEKTSTFSWNGYTIR